MSEGADSRGPEEPEERAPDLPTAIQLTEHDDGGRALGRSARARWASGLSIRIRMSWPRGLLGRFCAATLAVTPVGLVILACWIAERIARVARWTSDGEATDESPPAGSDPQVGASVRVTAVGWGGALDCYGVIEKISIADRGAFVRTKARSGWVHFEDLAHVRVGPSAVDGLEETKR